jgi:predicted trehalose synthase
MTLAEDVLADAIAAVDAVGLTVTMTSYADTYSTATGKNTRVATEHSVLASPPYSKDRSFGNDTQARGVATMIVPAATTLTLTIREGVKVEVGSVSYTVVAVEALQIQGTVVAYQLALAQGAPS